MSELKMALKQDEIRGFSYSFTKMLITKLEVLYKSDELFKDGNGNSSEKTHMYDYTNLGMIIISYLHDQLRQNFDANTPGVESMIKTGRDFLAIFEEETVIMKKNDPLEQNLRQFLLQKFDRSKVPGGERARAFHSLSCLGDKITIKELFEIPNPLKATGKGKWYNWGNKSFEWTKKEFTRLGFDVEKYPFFK